MKTQELISLKQICTHYKVPISFLDQLYDYDLIEIQSLDNDVFIRKTQIRDVEKIINLHYDLEINIEGVDAVFHLLKQIEGLKEEIMLLKNRLKLHEDL
ncbi:chaperone modulator CbpM [Lacinutrix chionoecetis]